jgi:hypothetical protein
VQLYATDPAGRGRVKLQVQACPSGAAFDDPFCVTQTTGAWTDVTASPDGVVVAKRMAGLDADRLYRPQYAVGA